MNSQQFYIQDEGTQVTVNLYGKLEVTTVAELNVAVDGILSEVPRRWGVIVVNLQGLDLIDSSGVAAINKLYRRGQQAGAQVYVTGARDQPLQVLRLLRMDRVFGM